MRSEAYRAGYAAGYRAEKGLSPGSVKTKKEQGSIARKARQRAIALRGQCTVITGGGGRCANAISRHGDDPVCGLHAWFSRKAG